ncbi:SPARC [Nematostella vectensis]|uniref:SPARC n=1 Tax=Nematostella vectensis TaxID=45351 RepID=UPI00138FD04B|nr:SPARC [Nematostella vectensis]
MVSPLVLVPIIACLILGTLTIPSKAEENAEDPCSKRVCMWGEMCRADSSGFTYCECPVSCPNTYEPVCSVYGIQFPNKCELHMFACIEGVNIGVKNKGPCVNKTGGSDPEPDARTLVCPGIDHMSQFRDRYLEWAHVAKEQTKDQNYTLTRRIHDMTMRQKVAIAKWEFDRNDLDKDNALEGAEIDNILAMMIYEPCAAGFLWSCDLNRKQGISRSEWDMCFTLAEREFPLRRQHK